MLNKKFALLLLAVVAVVEIISLVWIRGDYRNTLLDGAEYQVPATIDYKGDFYHKNYLSLAVPMTEAAWKGRTIPEKGEEIYLSLAPNEAGLMEITGAFAEKPAGDYIATRVMSYVEGTVHFNFPVDRMYMSPEQLQKLSVVELSERVQVMNEEKKTTETQMKNEVTALIRVKDGRVAVSRVLANGSPVEQTYTTVGKNMNIKYAQGPHERDQYTTRINAKADVGEE